MDVTKTNIKKLLPEIKEAIDNCTFLSFDCEFTGLNSNVKLSCFDSHKHYYEKIRQSSYNYIIIQFGLCTFRYDEENDVFKQKCYNFYIFPRQQDRTTPDRRFLCQSSSIDFLIGNNFDFNKLFREGISYLNKDEEYKCLELLSEKQKQREKNQNNQNNTKNLSVPADDREFIENNIKLIDEFLKTDEQELKLPKCNGFLRKLMYQSVQDRYGEDVCLETRIMENKDRVLFVIKTSAEQRAEKEKKRCDQELMDLKDNVGFSIVIQHISESGKLIIGHNLLLDILHITDKFMTPVPTEYEEFKECVHCLFPNIIDTKLMANMFPFKETIQSSVLENVLESVTQDPYSLPEIEIEEDGQGYLLSDKKQHEAGYDAFITGLCFLGMCQYLGKLDKKSEGKCVLPGSKLLEPFLNKIFLMKIQDYPYINLKGKDEIPPRDHVLHLMFPKDWKTSDIAQLFSPYGSIYIGWIDDASAYIELNNKDQAEKALNALKDSESCKLITYSEYQKILENNETIKFNKKNTNTPKFPSKQTEELTNIIKNKNLKTVSLIAKNDEAIPKKRKIVENIKNKIWFHMKILIMAVYSLVIYFFTFRVTKKRVRADTEESNIEQIYSNNKTKTNKTFIEDSTWD